MKIFYIIVVGVIVFWLILRKVVDYWVGKVFKDNGG